MQERPLPASVSSRLLIPEPKRDERRYFNENLYQIFKECLYDSMNHDFFHLICFGAEGNTIQVEEKVGRNQVI